MITFHMSHSSPNEHHLICDIYEMIANPIVAQWRHMAT